MVWCRCGVFVVASVRTHVCVCMYKMFTTREVLERVRECAREHHAPPDAGGATWMELDIVVVQRSAAEFTGVVVASAGVSHISTIRLIGI